MDDAERIGGGRKAGCMEVTLMRNMIMLLTVEGAAETNVRTCNAVCRSIYRYRSGTGGMMTKIANITDSGTFHYTVIQYGDMCDLSGAYICDETKTKPKLV